MFALICQQPLGAVFISDKFACHLNCTLSRGGACPNLVELVCSLGFTQRQCGSVQSPIEVA